MQTPTAQEALRLRKQLVEPVFGILKEQQGARRFLLRGVDAVRSEWSLMATAFNLRTLWKVWKRHLPDNTHALWERVRYRSSSPHETPFPIHYPRLA